MSVHNWKECFGNIQSCEKSFSHGLLPNLDAAKDIKKSVLNDLNDKAVFKQSQPFFG